MAFFYLLFPAAIGLLRPLNRRALTIVAVVCWLLALAPTAAALYATDAVRGLADRPDVWIVAVLKYNPLLRLPEFLFGAALGLSYVRSSAAVESSPQPRGGLTADLSAMAVVAALALLKAPSDMVSPTSPKKG